MMKRLSLQELASRHRGLTKAIADAYSEAAFVCLDRHHRSPTEFTIQDTGRNLSAIVEWTEAGERAKMAWANEIDATEAGAYACALAAVELSSGLFAVRRAETRTGADYYIAPASYEFEDLENCLRFEISGIDKGSPAAIEYRLKIKLQQAAKGESNLPAMAGLAYRTGKLPPTPRRYNPIP